MNGRSQFVLGYPILDREVSRFRKFGQRDKWKGCSPRAIKMPEKRNNDDATSTPEPHSGL